MGLACPVCDVPHADGEHLADHLAITAVLRHADHESWLDEHVSGWAAMGPAELGPLVADHAKEVDSVDLHEDVESHRHDHRVVRGRANALADDSGRVESVPVDPTREPGGGMLNGGEPSGGEHGELDEEARTAVRRARELAEQVQSDRDEGEDDRDESEETVAGESTEVDEEN